MPISKDQQKVLKSRLESINSDKPGRWDYVELPDTAGVLKARRQIEIAQAVLEAHKKKAAKITAERKASISKAYNRCAQLIAFGNPDAAIKALDEFEAQQF